MTTFEVYMERKILSKAKVKELKGLSSKKERDRKKLFLAEGDKCVRDLLLAFIPEFIISTEDWISHNHGICKKFENVLYITDKKTIGMISSLKSLPDVIAVFKIPTATEEIPALDKNKLYLLLDEIQDPGNLGTIIRTCDWFGVYDIYASKTTVDAYGPKVVQSTMGSLARVKIHYLDLEKLIQKNRDLKVIGTLLNGVNLRDSKIGAEGLLLMGNEGKGISDSLKKYIELPLTIPPVNPQSHPDSLNVAIATAVILSHIQV